MKSGGVSLAHILATPLRTVSRRKNRDNCRDDDRHSSCVALGADERTGVSGLRCGSYSGSRSLDPRRIVASQGPTQNPSADRRIPPPLLIPTPSPFRRMRPAAVPSSSPPLAARDDDAISSSTSGDEAVAAAATRSSPLCARRPLAQADSPSPTESASFSLLASHQVLPAQTCKYHLLVSVDRWRVSF